MLVVAVLVSVFLTGCGGRTEYVIEMKLEGGQLNRKLVVVEHGSQNKASSENGKPDGAAKVELGPEAEPMELSEAFRSELERIEKLYVNRALGTNGSEFVFQANFSGDLPKDVGGAGSFLYYSNSLGTASVYVERFRGHDDPAGRLQKQARAIDMWVDHLIAWSKQEPELGAKPDYEKLRAFLDVNLRQDLKNLGLYALRSGALNPINLEAEFVQSGSPIPRDEFSSRAWSLVLSHLPEPSGEAK